MQINLISRKSENFSRIRHLNFVVGERKKLISPNIEDFLIIPMTIGACMVDKKEEISLFLKSEPYAQWKKIYMDFSKVSIVDTRIIDYYIFADWILFLGYTIYKNTENFLKEVHSHIINNDEDYELTDSSKRYCNSDKIDIKEEKIQECVDNYVKTYLEFMNSIISGHSASEFTDYNDIIRELQNKSIDSRLAAEFLSPKQKGSRCFATYVTTNGKKYIAFSGFLDSENPWINNWLKNNTNQPFLTTAKNICSKLNATLVTSNLRISLYKFSNFSVIPYTNLGIRINECAKTNEKTNFSCCERKIIGYFDENYISMPDGTLYVKLEVCEKCDKAIWYVTNQGTKITVYEGLMV